ncbi:hypothetical protein TpMuguga_03g00112 [Theileria parva strain Muguga]|uniref:Protein SDA1 n=1 Tax=Theileria parva TaxID=5875 RepID=Q4N0K9_THEPA|nr:uncharacterized protein TpMuguga_03g00112 [Theileria parva strain Muguga]EAN30847.1 hypothetical protein TpMuguga_03g00112 [Theileria parva strain Muguga]|eukprot:XP_763130.1 hypothetical protein [Theileria parva strain Muguga]
MLELEVLQNNIKKDPGANFDNFYHRYNEFISLFEIVKLTPQIYNSDFIKLLDFIINTISFYNNANNNSSYASDSTSSSTSSSTNGTNGISGDTVDTTGMSGLCINLINYVKENKNILNEKMRKLIINSTFNLRTKRQINLQTVIIEWLELLDLNDRQQRKKLFNFILKDLIILSKSADKSAVKEVETILFNNVKSSNSAVIRLLSCSIILEMCRRRIWNNSYILNSVVNTVTAPKQQNTKLLLLLTHFLIQSKNYYGIVFEEEEDDLGVGSGPNNIILDLNEPFELVTNLLQRVNSSYGNLTYANKITILKLVAAVISKFKLTYPQFYELINKYINHKQPHITKILLVLITSTHEQLSSQILTPIINNLLLNFVSHDRDENVIIIGITTIREMCRRVVDLLKSEELLSYLSEFKHKSKNVNINIKSALKLFKEFKRHPNPKQENGPHSQQDGDSYTDSDEKSDENSDVDDTVDESDEIFERRDRRLENKMSLKEEKKLKKRLAFSKNNKRQSLTNKIKLRNKPLLMTLQSRRVKQKLNANNKKISKIKKYFKSNKCRRHY